MYHSDHLLDEVRYSLKEIEEVPNAAYSGGQDARAVEVRTISGIVTPTEIELLAAFPGIRLTLELEDGRRLDCAVTRVGDCFCLVKALDQPV